MSSGTETRSHGWEVVRLGRDHLASVGSFRLRPQKIVAAADFRRNWLEQHAVPFQECGNMAKRKTIKCPKCDRKFAMQAHVQRHLNTMHGAGGKRKTVGRRPVGRPSGSGALRGKSLDELLAVIDAARAFSDDAECLDSDCGHRVCDLNRALMRVSGRRDD